MAFEDDDKPVALQLSSAQRWQLVQEGYNPLDPESVQRYINKQPPDRKLAVGAAKAKKENLGSRSQNDDRDYGKLDKEVGYDDHEEAAQERSAPVNPREAIAKMTESYGGSSGKDIDSIVRSRLNTGTAPVKKKRPQQLEEQYEEDDNQPVGPIKRLKPLPVEQKQLITEAKGAANLGYRSGLSYLNAFIKLLKEPSAEARNTLIERLNTMVVNEDNIVPEMLKFYRGGVQKAEKELYTKLSTK